MKEQGLQDSERSKEESHKSFIESAKRVLDFGSNAISKLTELLNGEQRYSFIAAITLLRSVKGRVVVTGMGKSGHIGRKIAATFASTGCPAFFVHPSEAGHGDLGMITPEDIILALSWSGETAELKSLIEYSRRFRIPLIAVTAVADSALGKAADVVIQMPGVREACPHNLAPTTSALLQLLIGDALAIALLDSKGFSERDFHVFHPAGRLGAILRFVRDYMYVGARLPLIQSGARMADAIVEITAKGAGCVGIVDKEDVLIGIITDGDLRRHMQPGLVDLTVDEVMTKNPITTAPDQLASSALQQINASKVQVLFVTEAGRPVGVIHVHELLRAGVA
jgi:arabinose-5-phosphate isomerase